MVELKKHFFYNLEFILVRKSSASTQFSPIKVDRSLDTEFKDSRIMPQKKSNSEVMNEYELSSKSLYPHS